MHRASVKTSSIIARCLSILAIVGLLVVPTTGPAVAGASVLADRDAAMAVMSMDGMSMAAPAMERCADRQHVPPTDCGSHCPWAALCMAACVELGASPALSSLVPVILGAVLPADDPTLAPWSDGPPARPPRT